MNLGFDLDGVIIDHADHKKALLTKRGFSDAAHFEHHEIRNLLGDKEYKAFQNELYGRMSLYAPEIVGAKESLTRLKAAGHNLRIVSQRALGKDFAFQWLSDHGFQGHLFPDSAIHFVVTNEDKEIICRQFGIALHVDDSLSVLRILSTPQHRILFGYSGSIPPAATAVAPDWPSVERYIASRS